VGAHQVRGHRCRRWLRDTDASVEIEVVFTARRAIALARFIVPQASELVAPADAVAIAGLRCCLDGNERHVRESYGFEFILARGCHVSI
jgi:hypothetical protein